MVSSGLPSGEPWSRKALRSARNKPSNQKGMLQLQLQAPSKMLAQMDQTLIKITKSKIVAQNLIDRQFAYVEKLVVQGVLSAKDAGELFHELEHDEAALSKARKKAAREAGIATVEAHTAQLTGRPSMKRRGSFGELAASGTLTKSTSGDKLLELAHVPVMVSDDPDERT